MAFQANSVYGGPKFNIGTDQSVRITRDDTGAQVVLGGTMDTIRWTPKYTTEMTDSVDNGGRVFHRNIPSGYEGTITISRYNADLENFMKSLEAAYYAGQGQVECTVVHTINAPYDNSQSKDTYTHCVLHISDLGSWSRTKRQEVTLQIQATERL